ncbi:hypothetical protein C8J56DRAFT_897154 [Mycena floridula]|nr:hypothetical protein C8J56DRAFT_897154 [Mycena floridula]
MAEPLLETIQPQQSVGAYFDSLSNEIIEHIFLEAHEGLHRSALDLRAFRWVAGQRRKGFRERDRGVSEQWKDVRLNILNLHLSQPLFDQVNGRLSGLENLIWCYFPRDPSSVTVVAPILRDMTLPDILSTQAFPQWSQLKRIGLAHSSFRTIFSDLYIFQQSQQLEEIFLHYTYIEILPQPQLKFRHLRILSCAPDVLNIFLELPALQVLKLKNEDAFLRRTARQLVSLTLPSLLSSNSSTFIEAVNMLPGLKILDMSKIARDDTWQALVQHLSVDPQHPDQAVLPNLEHLTKFPRLKSLEWHARGEQRSGDCKCIQELEKQGLKVTWGSV